MKFLRTLSGRRLIGLVVAVLTLSGGAAAIAVAASGGGGASPQPKPLDQAIQAALAAPAPSGVTARITFTNNLFPSGALLGATGSALMSGATGRLWLTQDGHGRIELQSDAGDTEIVWDPTAVTVYDASSNTVYRATLPAHENGGTASNDTGAATLAEIDSFLSKLGAHATISGPDPTNIAGQPAYSVSLSPKHDGGLLASAELAWDAAQGMPLRVAIVAQGSSEPVLQVEVTDISYGPVPASAVDVSPPADAKVVDLGTLGAGGPRQGAGNDVTGLDAVQAAVGFPVAAPQTLVGLPRKDVRLVGGSDSKAALAVYGQGLGAIIVVERKADSAAGNGGALSSLPSVSLDGVTAHELATQLGTAIEWQKAGVDYVLAGSVPPAAAEAAARSLT